MFVNGAGSIVSSKVYLAANDRTQAALTSEESQDLQLKSQERGIKESIKSKLTRDSNYQLVLFDDPTSGERVSALISKENMERLQEKFNKKDFYAREDGNMRLSGKAEAYVSGWYAEIMGNVGAQRADLNQDGKFSENERGLLRDGYSFELSQSQSFGNPISVLLVEGNTKSDDTEVRTTEDLLDNFISQDKDLNGKISVQEHFEVTRGSLYSALKGILESQENPLAEMAAQSQATNPTTPNKEELDVSAMEEAMRLLAKIKQSGNLNALSPEEQALVRQYFAGEVEQIKQQSQDTDVINQHLDRKIRDFVEQMGSNESLILSTKA